MSARHADTAPTPALSSTAQMPGAPLGGGSFLVGGSFIVGSVNQNPSVNSISADTRGMNSFGQTAPYANPNSNSLVIGGAPSHSASNTIKVADMSMSADADAEEDNYLAKAEAYLQNYYTEQGPGGSGSGGVGSTAGPEIRTVN